MLKFNSLIIASLILLLSSCSPPQNLISDPSIDPETSALDLKPGEFKPVTISPEYVPPTKEQKAESEGVDSNDDQKTDLTPDSPVEQPKTKGDSKLDSSKDAKATKPEIKKLNIKTDPVVTVPNPKPAVANNPVNNPVKNPVNAKDIVLVVNATKELNSYIDENRKAELVLNQNSLKNLKNRLSGIDDLLIKKAITPAEYDVSHQKLTDDYETDRFNQLYESKEDFESKKNKLDRKLNVLSSEAKEKLFNLRSQYLTERAKTNSNFSEQINSLKVKRK